MGADIVNRTEVLVMPLEEAGPEIKMVPSLAPIWEVRGSETDTDVLQTGAEL